MLVCEPPNNRPTPPTVTTTDYDVNALNQYDAIGGTSRPTPHHDDDGNLIDDGDKEYVWDAENRLVEVIDAATSNTVATYGYDYMGRRVRKTTTASAPQGATDTIFAYDGWTATAANAKGRTSPQPARSILASTTTTAASASPA